MARKRGSEKKKQIREFLPKKHRKQKIEYNRERERVRKKQESKKRNITILLLDTLDSSSYLLTTYIKGVNKRKPPVMGKTLSIITGP